jgi:hypothetical protein
MCNLVGSSRIWLAEVGTYVDGARVVQTPVSDGQLIAIGHHQLRLRGDRLEEYAGDGDGAEWLVASELTATASDGRIVPSDIEFALPPRRRGGRPLVGSMPDERPDENVEQGC